MIIGKSGGQFSGEIVGSFQAKKTIPNQQDSIVLNGEINGNRFGVSVSSAGDLNGDGYSDVIIGAVEYDNHRGRAYIFYGGENMDNIADVTLTGEVSSYFGCSVSNAGDVNGDGYSDVIIGAYNFNGNRTGGAFIFYGGAFMNNVADLIMIGEIYSGFGYSVSTSGDLNGDTYSDVIVGASDYNSGTGRAYIFYGGLSMNNIADVIMEGESTNNYFGNSVSNAGDVNGDGYSDVIIGASGFSTNIGRSYIYYGGYAMNNISDVIMTGEYSGNYFGCSVSTAGDVNGDGYSDVIIGAYRVSVNKGRAYIYYGGSVTNNIADVIMLGESENSFFGYSVSTLGDLNGDGYSDVIIGSYLFESAKGRAYIYYGGTAINNTSNIKLTGDTNNGYFGISVSSAGDINRDGYPDVIIGASEINKVYLFVNLMPEPILINPQNNSFNNLTTLNFCWKNENTNLYYILDVSMDSTFNNSIVKDTIYNDTSKTISGLQKGKKYYWKVTAIDSSGSILNSSIWNFTTIPPLYINIKLLFEGMYFPTFNQLIRKDSVTAYIRQSIPPFNIIDSAKSIIDSNSFTGLFYFYNAETGTYYITMNHFNSIETWSKVGGEHVTTDGILYNYDFTISYAQAFGNNLKLKGSKYCIYSGDVNQDGYITLFDVIPIYNDATNFVTGNYLLTDLTGDRFVDLNDITICYNNSINFITVRQP